MSSDDRTEVSTTLTALHAISSLETKPKEENPERLPNFNFNECRDIRDAISELVETTPDMLPSRRTRLRALLAKLERERFPPEITALLERARPIAEYKALPLDVWLDSGKNGLLSEYLVDGWSHSEDWGCWSVGVRSSLDVLIANLDGADVIAEFIVQGFVSTSTPRQQVRVVVNNEDRAVWWFTSRAESVLKTFQIPARGQLFGRDSALLRIEFEIASPESPLQAGLSEDPRRLGLGLRRVRFSRASVPLLHQGVGYDVPLQACNGGALTRYLISGWGMPMLWGRMALHPEAQMRLPIAVPAGLLVLEFLLKAYHADGAIVQIVDVLINGDIADTWMLSGEQLVVKRVERPFSEDVDHLFITFQMRNDPADDFPQLQSGPAFGLHTIWLSTLGRVDNA